MKPEQTHIDHIRTAFQKMESREDLLQLLNEVKPLVYGEKAVPFDLKQLTWYANPKLARKRYTSFKIKKKSGSNRTIYAPVKGLKSLQKTLSFALQCVYEPHRAAMGFVRGKSIVDNARIHEGSKYVYNIDLKDFFSSIDQARVWKCLQLKPFNLYDELNTVVSKKFNDLVVEKILFHPKSRKTAIVIFTDDKMAFVSVEKGFKQDGNHLTTIFCDDETNVLLPDWQVVEFYNNLWIVKSNNLLNSISREFSRKGIADIIASLCCTEIEVERKNEDGEWEIVKRNVLPQGAPTSPVLTNIICQRLDFILSGVAKRFGLKYSRYADDITFSSMHNVYQQESEFLKELDRVITEQGFHIKESKTRLLKEGYRKEVTGLLVNEKANVQKRYIKQLRMWLYYWERYGYEKACSFFLQQYLADKGNIVKGKPDMANVIAGKLDYLKMVKGFDNELYLKLKGRFNVLANNTETEEEETKTVSPENASIEDLGADLYEANQGRDYKEGLKAISDALKQDKKSTTAYESYAGFMEEVSNNTEDFKDVLHDEESIARRRKKTALNKDEDTKMQNETKTNPVRISLELFHNPEKNGKLNNSINIPKNTVLPSSLIVPNPDEEEIEIEVVPEDIKTKKLFPHNPIYTISFLKKFKIGDGSGFKELVHDVILSDEIVEDILNKVKSHPNFIYHFKKEWISDVSFLNLGIVMSVRELIDFFEKEGLRYYQISHKHPFNNDSEYTNYAKQFKKKYRYGSGSEYSKLQSDIINIFKDQKVQISSLLFMPDERKFNIRSSFFTWQPSIYNGIRYIIQGIADHSNINGELSFNPNDKKILVEVERKQSESQSFVELNIFDCNSIAKIDSTTLLQFLQGSSPYKSDFRNLCDWIVECDFIEESSKRINLLIAPEYSQSLLEIEDLPFTVGGFKHIIRFYDPI